MKMCRTAPEEIVFCFRGHCGTGVSEMLWIVALCFTCCMEWVAVVAVFFLGLAVKQSWRDHVCATSYITGTFSYVIMVVFVALALLCDILTGSFSWGLPLFRTLHGLGHLEFTFKQVYNTNTSSSSEVQLLFFKGSHLFLLKYLGVWLVLCVAAVGYVVSLFFLSAAPAPQLGCLLLSCSCWVIMNHPAPV